jgi:hypothetical protein
VRHITLKISFFVCTIFFSLFLNQALAQAQKNQLSGYAWSSNIGWISFNDSKVEVNQDGTLSGYAWSPNIGWLQFGNLINFPSGTGTTNLNAKISDNKIVGWAKFVAGSSSSGWDGWVSFDGNGYSISKNATTNYFSGYGWGSTVVGWVDFSKVLFPNYNDLLITCPTDNLTIPFGSQTLNKNVTFKVTDRGNVTYKWGINSIEYTTTVPEKSIDLTVKTLDNPGNINIWNYAVPIQVTQGADTVLKTCNFTVTDSNKCPDGKIKPAADSNCSNNDTTPTLEPSLIKFLFSPNTATPGGSCKMNLEIENIYSCELKNRIGTTFSLSLAIDNKYNLTSFGTYPVGTYNLFCQATSTAEAKQINKTSISCYSNSDVKEN